jgi:DNA-binding response OmpR family regulator
MPGLSSLVIAESDSRTVEAVKFAFEREGVSVATAQSRESVGSLVEAKDGQLVIVGAEFSAQPGIELLLHLRAGWKQGNGAVPLLYLGEEPEHERAYAAGATQCLPRPVFARDVVTMARLLANRKQQGGPATFVGDLGDFYGVYYLVRALAAVKWRGVLTLVRGLRRGELRLYKGEVTSAQVGVLHGLAALHQLLLWTEARLELRVEEVVRRRQIPLEPAEALADAERFLNAIRAEAGPLSPAAVYEQDAQHRGEDVPKQVLPVLRLFDGHRMIADVIEDSPYRVFETLRLSVRLAELGIIRRVGTARKSPAHAALAIEEWLVGSSPVPEPTVRAASEPVGPEPGEPASPPGQQRQKSQKSKQSKSQRKRERRAARQQQHVGSSNGSRPTDWSALLPSATQDLPGYASVVPSVSTGGEISIRRERLEEVTNAVERATIFGGGATAADAALQTRAPAASHAPEPATPREIKTDPTVPLPRKQDLEGQPEPTAALEASSSASGEIGGAAEPPPRESETASALAALAAAAAPSRESETASALAALPAPTPRLGEEAAEAVHAAHDAAEAARLALAASRSQPMRAVQPEPEPVPEPIDDGWAADTEVVPKVDVDEVMLKPPAPSPEVSTSGEIDAAPVAISGQLDSGKIRQPSVLHSEPEASIVIDEAVPEPAPVAPTTRGPAPAPALHVEPPVPQAPAPVVQAPAPVVQAPAPAPHQPPPQAYPVVSPQTHIPPRRAATPFPQQIADDAARMHREAARAAEAVAAFSAEEEEFFRAGHQIQEQHTAPIETFDDLETEPPKTFWQRLVSRPDAVKRAGTEPSMRVQRPQQAPKKKKP